MKSKSSGGRHFLRLFPGEDVVEKIKEFCGKKKISSAVIVSGIGMLKEFELGELIEGGEGGEYEKRFFREPHELCSMQGNIAFAGNELIVHLHVVLSKGVERVKAGHLFRGKVNATNEIFIEEFEGLKREFDEETGLKQIKID